MQELPQESQPKQKPVIWVQESSDVDYFHSVVRSEDVFPNIKNDLIQEPDAVDLRPLVANQDHYFLEVWEEETRVGFFMLICKAPGTYEVHTNLTKTCRGEKALAAGKAAMRYMSCRTPSFRLVSLCPEHLPHALAFARNCGFSVDFVKSDSWPLDGKMLSVTHVSLSIYDWLRNHAVELEPIGQAFHDTLFHSLEKESHPEDSFHNRMVGFAMYTAAIGNWPLKAEMLYNEWGAVAGYAPVQFLGERDGQMFVNVQTALIALDHQLGVKVLMKAG